MVRIVRLGLLALGVAATAPGSLITLHGAAQAGAAAQAVPAPAVPRVPLTAGRSTVITTDFEITRIAVTNPAVADAVVVQPREVLIDGKAPGTISLIIWGSVERRQYDVVVEPPVTTLEQRLQALFPGEDIHVSANDEAIILSGRVSGNAASLRAEEIAAATSSKAKVVNLLQLPGGAESQQVLLQVRVAEVSRQALRELGAGFFTSPLGFHDTLGRITTQQFAAPGFDTSGTDTKLTFSDYLNLFVYSTKYDLGAVVRALQNKGLFQSLAEPNLIAYNGQDASFLAGGEIPVPVVQGLTNSVSIQWKEYGVRLNFTPRIAGDTIRLKVKPEVSTLDFANGITLSGFRIPALSTRRAETDVELRDGQSFAIAGLLNNLSQDTINEVPGLARIPILGHLFQSKSTRAERNELMVLVTPRLVRPLNPDEVPPLPTLPKRFLQPDEGLGQQFEGGGGLVDGPDVKNPKRSDERK